MNARAFQRRYDNLRKMVDARLASAVRDRDPRELHNACRYVLTGGGKRIRAVLVMLSCEATGGRAERALEAATAVEMLHNFTLVHDDIMDNAAERRGRPTVHRRWGVNGALLVGDVLIGLALQDLMRVRTERAAEVAALLARGHIDVCEGQALDLQYERRRRVTVREYFRMIERKTGRLFSTAVAIGGVLGGGTAREIAALTAYGKHLGRAFQLQDDLLDVVGDRTRFGKTIGGDIVEGKKTFLLLTAAQRTRGADRRMLEAILRRSAAERASPLRTPMSARASARDRAKIAAVTAIYARSGVLNDARRLIRQESARAQAALAGLRSSTARSMLGWLADQLAERGA